MNRNRYSVRTQPSGDSLQSLTLKKDAHKVPKEQLKKLSISDQPDVEDKELCKLIYETESSENEVSDSGSERGTRKKREKKPLHDCGDARRSSDDESEIDLDLINDDFDRVTPSKSNTSNNSNPLKDDKKNITFSSEKMKQIERENEMLVKKILSQNKLVKPKQDPKVNKVSSSAAVNRKKAQWNIDRTNQILFKKIQAAKASGVSIRKKAPICRDTKMHI